MKVRGKRHPFPPSWVLCCMLLSHPPRGGAYRCERSSHLAAPYTLEHMNQDRSSPHLSSDFRLTTCWPQDMDKWEDFLYLCSLLWKLLHSEGLKYPTHHSHSELSGDIHSSTGGQQVGRRDSRGPGGDGVEKRPGPSSSLRIVPSLPCMYLDTNLILIIFIII